MSRPMKDSGVEWIGEIPEHWDLTKLKNEIQFVNGYAFDSNDLSIEKEGYPVIRIGDFTNAGIDIDSANRVTKEIPSISNYQISNNDILIAMSGGTVGKLAYVKAIAEKAYINQRVGIIRAENSKFIYHYLNSGEFLKYIFLLAGGTAQPNISTVNIKNFHITCPPEEEQQTIATFLDNKTAQIDSIINNTKQSIVEFKKYKQALITETVTKGLNPNAKMKESEIEWMGKIPKHWDTWKLKQLFEIKKVIAGKLGHDILSITQNGLKIKDISNNEGQISADYSKYQIVEIGDFAMNHMDLLTGWVDCATFSGVTSPDYRVFRSRNSQTVDNTYYKYIFQACYSNKIFYGLGQGVSNLGRWRLPTSNFLNFAIPHSPIEEQQQIADYLEQKCVHIDSLIADKEKLIREFEDYKKALIYEYVTGKKEVE